MASYIGASAEQEDADPILMAFAAEATKGDPASPEARELVLRWQAHLVKFSRSCDEEKLRRLADLYSWDNRFAEVLDSYGPGTAHFMGEAIEAYLETLWTPSRTGAKPPPPPLAEAVFALPAPGFPACGLLTNLRRRRIIKLSTRQKLDAPHPLEREYSWTPSISPDTGTRTRTPSSPPWPTRR